MQQGAGDSTRFDSQKHAQDMHRLSLSTTTDGYRQLSQCSRPRANRVSQCVDKSYM